MDAVLKEKVSLLVSLFYLFIRHRKKAHESNTWITNTWFTWRKMYARWLKIIYVLDSWIILHMSQNYYELSS